MALSKKVEEYLLEAQGNIRNALACAARSERAITIHSLGKLLNDVEALTKFDNLLDKIDKDGIDLLKLIIKKDNIIFYINKNIQITS